MKKPDFVELTLTERDELNGLIKRGPEAACRRRHAQDLMPVDVINHLLIQGLSLCFK
jgi:hypothetical protein